MKASARMSTRGMSTLAAPKSVGRATAATRAKRLQWSAARRWRRRVEVVIADSGLKFFEWLVLDALRLLIEATDDAVIQNDLALHLELDRNTVSRAVTALAEAGYVSRGIDVTGRAWRLWLTDEGEAILCHHDPLLEWESARLLGISRR